MQQQIAQQYEKMVAEYGQAGIALEDMPQPPEPNIQETTYEGFIQQKLIEVAQVQVSRIHQCVVIGDKKLYSRTLPTDQYPIIPFCNIHTRTPYPVSDVRMVKNMQEYINKTRSLIVAHATTSTNTKILVPEGSVDMKEFEEKWSEWLGVDYSVYVNSGGSLSLIHI